MTSFGNVEKDTLKPTQAGKPLTIAQTAQRLGWHPDDVRRCIRHEQIPVIRCGASGRKLRVPAEWVAENSATDGAI